MLELDYLVALPVVGVAHHLFRWNKSSYLIKITTITFHTSPVSPSPISPKAETSCWLVSGDEKWWLCRFLGMEKVRAGGRSSTCWWSGAPASASARRPPAHPSCTSRQTLDPESILWKQKCFDRDTNLEKPVRVDILILSASSDRLLPRPTPIFHIVAVVNKLCAMCMFKSGLLSTAVNYGISCVSYLCNLILWFWFISFTTLPHVTCNIKLQSVWHKCAHLLSLGSNQAGEKKE